MDTVNTRDIYSYFEYEGKMYKCPFDKFVLQISEIDENMAQKGNGLYKKEIRQLRTIPKTARFSWHYFFLY